MPTMLSVKRMVKRTTNQNKLDAPSIPILLGISSDTVVVAWNYPQTDAGLNESLRLEAARGWKCPNCSFVNKIQGTQCLQCTATRPWKDLVRGDKHLGKFLYQVKFHRTGHSLESWSKSTYRVDRFCVITGLKPATRYDIIVRVAKNNAGKPEDQTMSSNSETLEVNTISIDHELRLNNIGRLNAFLKDGFALPPYAEDVVVDSYSAKASRATDGLLKLASLTGIGGHYVELTKNAWKLKKSGIAGVIFREDLQFLVYALSKFVGTVAEHIGLSPQDVTVGSYYMLWEHKRQRLMYPDAESQAHNLGSFAGVLQAPAPQEFLHELAWFSPLAKYAYRNTPAQIQWVLRHFPSRHETEHFKLVMCNTKSRPTKPAFTLMAHEQHKLAVLAIRGTAEMNDLLTDALCDATTAPFQFHRGDSTIKGAPEIGSPHNVHRGMLESANWLINGDPTIDTTQHKRRHRRSKVEFSDDSQGCGIGYAVRKMHEAGYRLVFVGHSLGAGVATLSALVLCDREPDLKVRVYGYGTPACVDEELAEACKGEFSGKYASDEKHPPKKLAGLGDRVTVVNFINRDDLVPRLCLTSAADFANQLKASRSHWEPLLRQDIQGFTQRAKTLWAPNARSHEVKRNGETSVNYQNSKVIHTEPTNTTNYPRLVPPGLIVHSYRHRGTDHASLVDYRFKSLRKIEAYSSMIDDHHLTSTLNTMRNIQAVRKAEAQGNAPPVWESISDHYSTNDNSYVKCAVCNYFVGWLHTGDSDAVEIRGTKNCYACGRIVCEDCSRNRKPLPEIGILNSARVCDDCDSKLTLADAANNGSKGLDVGDLLSKWEATHKL